MQFTFNENKRVEINFISYNTAVIVFLAYTEGKLLGRNKKYLSINLCDPNSLF